MKQTLNLICIFVSTIIGASFITGSEIFTYFAKYGTKYAYILCFANFIICFIFSFFTLLKFKKANKETFISMFKSQNASKITTFIKKSLSHISFLTFFCFSCLMLSGIRSLFGNIFCFIFLILCICLIKFFPLKSLLVVNKFFLPFCILYIIILVFIAPRTQNTINVCTIDMAAFINLFPYMLLNVFLALPSSVQLAKSMSTKHLFFSCLLASLILSILICFEIYLLTHIPQASSDMPFIHISSSNIFHYFSLSITFFAMFTSFLASLYGINEKLPQKNKLPSLITICLLIFAFSFIDFTSIMQFSYALIGTLSCIVIFYILLRKL